MFNGQLDIVHMMYLHDRVWAHRAHGKEMEDCKEDQHCLLKWSLLKWKKGKTNNNKNSNKELIHLSAWILAGLDQEVDNVEDVEGSPREEEHDTHANQDPVRKKGIMNKPLVMSIFLFSRKIKT